MTLRRALTNLLAVALASLAPALAAPAAETGEIRPLAASQLARKSVRVAAVQITGPWQWQVATRSGNDPADTIVPHIDRAGRDRADLVVFPELFLGFFRVPSPQTDKVAAAARRNRVNTIIGCFEVLDDRGDYGNSTLIFDRDGKIVGRYLKLYQAVGRGPACWPPLPDDPEWMMTPGGELPLFDLDFGRIGVLTCYDGYFPEVFRLLSLKGAELIVWPNARQGCVEDHIVKTNVQWNYVHMVCTNKALGAGTMIAEWPQGVVRQCAEPKEAYLLADLDLARLRQGRIQAREFRQRRAALFADLAKHWPVAEAYGVNEVDLPIPPPSPEAKAKALERAGIQANSPAGTGGPEQ